MLATVLSQKQFYTDMHLLLGIFSLANIFIASSASNNCIRMTDPTPQNQFVHTVLDNSTYFTFRTMDLKFCGIQCLRESQCQSVNFEPLTEICELNEQSFENNTDSHFFPMLAEGVSYWRKEDLKDLKVCIFSKYYNYFLFYIFFL